MTPILFWAEADLSNGKKKPLPVTPELFPGYLTGNGKKFIKLLENTENPIEVNAFLKTLRTIKDYDVNQLNKELYQMKGYHIIYFEVDSSHNSERQIVLTKIDLQTDYRGKVQL